MRLYAGAGIVPASVPAEELTETAVKLRTLLDALGLDSSSSHGRLPWQTHADRIARRVSIFCLVACDPGS